MIDKLNVLLESENQKYLENTKKLKSFNLTQVVSSVEQLKKVLYKKKNV